MNNEVELERSFIFYVATLLFFSVGAITTLGLDWYNNLVTPWWTPPQLMIATVWFLLFLSTAKSASLFWETGKKGSAFFRSTISLYLANAMLVLFWNYAFFGLHDLMLAQWIGIVIGISVVLLMVRLRSDTHWPSVLLLIPYVAWVPLALWITHAIMQLNPGL